MASRECAVPDGDRDRQGNWRKRRGREGGERRRTKRGREERAERVGKGRQRRGELRGQKRTSWWGWGHWQRWRQRSPRGVEEGGEESEIGTEQGAVRDGKEGSTRRRHGGRILTRGAGSAGVVKGQGTWLGADGKRQARKASCAAASHHVVRQQLTSLNLLADDVELQLVPEEGRGWGRFW